MSATRFLPIAAAGPLASGAAAAADRPGLAAPAVTALFSIEEDGRMVATRRLTVTLNERASVTNDHEGGFAVEATVRRIADGGDRVIVEAILSRWQGGRWSIVATSTVMTAPGSEASVDSATPMASRPTPIGLLVTENRPRLRPLTGSPTT